MPRTVTPTTLTKEPLDQLRAADHIVTQVLTKYNLLRTLAQVPVVLFPISFGGEGQRSIGIRAFITRDFMTGVLGQRDCVGVGGSHRQDTGGARWVAIWGAAGHGMWERARPSSSATALWRAAWCGPACATVVRCRMRRRRADGAVPAHTGRAKRSAVPRASHKFLSPSYVRDRA